MTFRKKHPILFTEIMLLILLVVLFICIGASEGDAITFFVILFVLDFSAMFAVPIVNSVLKNNSFLYDYNKIKSYDKKNNIKNINLVKVEDLSFLDVLRDGSALTFITEKINDYYLNAIYECLDKKNRIKNDKLTIYHFNGKDMKEKFNYLGVDEKTSFLCIELSEIIGSNSNEFAHERIGYGGRFFDDVVSNGMYPTKENLIKIAKIISNNDLEVISNLSKYFEDSETYPEGEEILALVHALKEKNYCVFLEYYPGVYDTKEKISKLSNMIEYDYELYLDEDFTAEKNCHIINKILSKQNLCIARIDIMDFEDDSFFVFITSIDNIPILEEISCDRIYSL